MIAENDYPTPYGSLPEGEMKKCCDDLCECKTVSEIQQMADYFSKKASDMRREMEKIITIEDFEKMSKRNASETDDAEQYTH